jgi:nitroimidazol reductase NimA-like FMN-containing flavoprotein (pyridoxamine 5'-phosphate oxidase superfamily)
MTRSQRRGRSIAMTSDEMDEYLAHALVCRVATLTEAGPHNVPLWFHWDGRSIWLYSIVRSQRWTDLERDPRVAVVVDGGEDWSMLHGVQVQGRARVRGEVPRTGGPADDELLAVEAAFHSKYRSHNPKYRDRPSAPFEFDGRHAWLCVEPEKLTSWDFRKITPATV